LVRPQKPQELSLKDLIAVLRKHYQPGIVVIAERYRFYKRPQREGEAIASYVAELRRLAKDCDFGEYLNTALRDQLVCGLFSETLQQVLTETDLTLEKAVEMAQAFETAAQETRLLRCTPAAQQSMRPPTQQSETTHSVRQETTDGSTQRKLPVGTRKEYAVDVEVLVTLQRNAQDTVLSSL
jgi:hypothetical protein